MFYEKRRIFFAPIASIAESIVMQPLDTIKVLRQSNQPLPTTFRSYYKGFTPFISQMSVKYFLRFSSFELLKSKDNNFYHNFSAGIVSGFTESLFITPFELIKTNLQTTKNNSPFTVAKDIYKTNGIKGLYRGFTTTFFRQGINQAFNFSVYNKIKDNLMIKDEKPNIFKIAFSSLISSSIGPILNNPFDVVKTRYMNPKYKYDSLKMAFSDIVKNDGYSYLFKGLGLRLFRVSGGQVIIFITIENLMYYTS
jgi:hypothetical protein